MGARISAKISHVKLATQNIVANRPCFKYLGYLFLFLINYAILFSWRSIVCTSWKLMAIVSSLSFIGLAALLFQVPTDTSSNTASTSSPSPSSSSSSHWDYTEVDKWKHECNKSRPAAELPSSRICANKTLFLGLQSSSCHHPPPHMGVTRVGENNYLRIAQCKRLLERKL